MGTESHLFKDDEQLNSQALTDALTCPGKIETVDAFMKVNLLHQTMTDATDKYQDKPVYATPKFRAGSVVTYLYRDQYRMGRILAAKLYGTSWEYDIEKSEALIQERDIKEVIAIDNQEFIENL